MRVVIVTEGFNGTGYGHLTRCLSLYQAFVERGVIPKFVANCDDGGRNYIAEARPIVLDWMREENSLYCLTEGSDVVFIDSYLAPPESYQRLASATRHLACIDDYIRIDFPPGTVINGTIGAESLPYTRDSKHEYLLGIDYVPLRKEFWDVQLKPAGESIRDVLLIFGAQDIAGMTGRTLAYLQRAFPGYVYHVVNGSALEQNSNRTDSEKTRFYRNLSASEMLSLMMRCDLAISAAGQTTYELARVGIPTIAIGVAENQRNNIKGWLKNGFLREELWTEDADLFEKLGREISRAPQLLRDDVRLCDGQGARRLAEFFLT